MSNKKFLKKQLETLNQSIEKWEKIVYCNGVDKGRRNCPLCQVYTDCRSCPIFNYVGRKCCFGTPYTKWATYCIDKDFYFFKANDAKAKRLANRELTFLYEVQRWLICKLYHRS